MTPIFIKKEMANFRHDDVLLKWEITDTGRRVGSYSHFNSMMKRSIQGEQSDNDREPVYGANNSQVKIRGNAVGVGEGKCGCEVRNTYTWGAEAGDVNE
jgi:hypothetical protein